MCVCHSANARADMLCVQAACVDAGKGCTVDSLLFYFYPAGEFINFSQLELSENLLKIAVTGRNAEILVLWAYVGQMK